jgi:sugar-specific transcriptional regulator TrmB
MLRLGKTSAAHISKEAQIPYGRIYTVLESLEEKGLVRVVPEKTKKYIPTDPDKLHEIIDMKIKGLMDIDNHVKELKKIYEEKTIEPVLIAKGKSSFHKISAEIDTAEKYEYSIKYLFSLSPEFIRSAREKKVKGVEYRTLGRVDEETKPNLKEWMNLDKNIRPIENEGVAISIADDKHVMIGLIKSNTTMLIRDAAFAKVMKELFTRYYMNTDAPEMK